MSSLMIWAKRLVVLLAIAIIIVVILFFANPDAALDILSRNIYLYSGIMMIGGFGFAFVALRILISKTNSWDAILEGVCISGLGAAIIIYNQGNTAWIIPGWCALLTSVGCFFLRYLDPRRDQ